MNQPTPVSPPESTKEALLDAAERLFAEQGITGTSVRAVTTAAVPTTATARSSPK